MEQIDSIIADLESIEERLMELSMSVLSEAIESGVTERPQMEKRISQARRTVAKAKHQLQGSNTD